VFSQSDSQAFSSFGNHKHFPSSETDHETFACNVHRSGFPQSSVQVNGAAIFSVHFILTSSSRVLQASDGVSERSQKPTVSFTVAQRPGRIPTANETNACESPPEDHQKKPNPVYNGENCFPVRTINGFAGRSTPQNPCQRRQIFGFLFSDADAVSICDFCEAGCPLLVFLVCCHHFQNLLSRSHFQSKISVFGSKFDFRHFFRKGN
jgi:hypothetical protein